MAKFNRIHAICHYLNFTPDVCKKCPAWQKTPYGKAKSGCRALAEEVFNIVKHGNPWGTRAVPKHARNWRKRSANEKRPHVKPSEGQS